MFESNKSLSKLIFLIYLILISPVNANDINHDDSSDLLSSSLSLLLQPSINSLISVQQTGSLNDVIAFQSGQNNQIKLEQQGDLNQIIAVQYGEKNEINIHQYGENNRADIYQYGTFNLANISQSGGQYFLLEQYGDFCVVNITQF